VQAGPAWASQCQCRPAWSLSSCPTSLVSLPLTTQVVDVVLASEVLYDPREAAPLARSAAALLSGGGTLLLADPAAGRIKAARAAAAEALRELGARVSEQPLETPPAGDGWYSLRAGDGKARGALPTEAMVLLRADFDRPPAL